VKAETEVII